jgi:hypothetical protein
MNDESVNFIVKVYVKSMNLTKFKLFMNDGN